MLKSDMKYEYKWVCKDMNALPDHHDAGNNVSEVRQGGKFKPRLINNQALAVGEYRELAKPYRVASGLSTRANRQK